MVPNSCVIDWKKKLTKGSFFQEIFAYFWKKIAKNHHFWEKRVQLWSCTAWIKNSHFLKIILKWSQIVVWQTEKKIDKRIIFSRDIYLLLTKNRKKSSFLRKMCPEWHILEKNNNFYDLYPILVICSLLDAKFWKESENSKKFQNWQFLDFYWIFRFFTFLAQKWKKSIISWIFIQF